VVITVGPLAGTYIEAFENMPAENRPNLWVVTELPIEHNPLPDELIAQIEQSSSLCVAEEHVRHSGFGSDLLLYLAEKNIAIRNFRHLYARAHHYERYGSQNFLRKQSALDVESMLATLMGL
jgi:transketolase